jgi:hypothetical protein
VASLQWQSFSPHSGRPSVIFSSFSAARAAWGLTWAGRVGESAITTETTTLMSAVIEGAAAEQ